MRMLLAPVAVFLCAWVQASETYVLPPEGDDLIGEIRYTVARHEDTLLDIARAFDIGQDAIVLANPGVDRWLPKQGTKVLIPSQFVLPDAPRNGLVLNVSEMRLYYYPPKSRDSPGEVWTFPVSIGRMDWKTPLGRTRVAQKVRDPVWIPPPSIRREHAAEGDILPPIVPAGPDNPLGRFALKLAIPRYLIHGTERAKSFGIGMRVTHGCVRMYNEDIERLFPMVRVGTPVHIVDQPVKVGWLAGTLYLEVHAAIEENRLSDGDLLARASKLVRKKTGSNPVSLNEAALKKAVQEKRGIPVPIASALAQYPTEYPSLEERGEAR
jgi:L,D-transpeptidase ErfK/SrfK